MARGGGSAKAGHVYHLISRFVAREFFIESAVERNTYLSLLGFMIGRSDWRCFSYAIMSNHIHLGLVAGEEPLAEWLRPMHTHFAEWINQRRERIGAVFVKGPNFIDVMPHGAPHVISYIHQNPVRAGVVAHARDSDWTSHRAYVGLARRPPWLDVQLGLQLGGFADGAAFEAWSQRTRVEREDLERLRVRKPRARRAAPRPRVTEERSVAVTTPAQQEEARPRVAGAVRGEPSTAQSSNRSGMGWRDRVAHDTVVAASSYFTSRTSPIPVRRRRQRGSRRRHRKQGSDDDAQ